MVWKSWKLGVAIILLMGLISLLAFGLVTDPKFVPSPLIGKVAPDFEVTSLDGASTLKLSDLRGKPVVLNFWGSWCPPCRAESPILESFYQKYDKQSRQIRLLGIAIHDTQENAGKFAKKFGKTYFLALDGDDGAISIDYGLYGAPETFFIDKDGIIKYKHISGVTPKLMEEQITKLLQVSEDPQKSEDCQKTDAFSRISCLLKNR